MGKYETEAGIYRSNANKLKEILDKASTDIDSINGLLNEISSDILIGNIILMTKSIKTKISGLKNKLNSNSTSLSMEASRLDRLEEKRMRILMDQLEKEYGTTDEID